MKRIRLVLAYDGTDYRGWAEQRNAVTIQGTLKECISRVSGEHVDLCGASRTDSGAHARGQTADFLTANTMPTARWASVLNRLLPPAIEVIRSDQVPLEFNARFYAFSRTYEYRLSEKDKLDPWTARFVHPVAATLNIAAMMRAGNLIAGKHDFRAFGEQLNGVENTVRELYKVAIARSGDEVNVKVVGTAFLRGMVRRLTGAILEVGKGKQDCDWIAAMLNPRKRDSVHWAKVLPACGLCLVKVDYGKVLKDSRQRNDNSPDGE